MIPITMTVTADYTTALTGSGITGPRTHGAARHRCASWLQCRKQDAVRMVCMLLQRWRRQGNTGPHSALTKQQLAWEGAIVELLGLNTEPVQHSKRCWPSSSTSMSSQVEALRCKPNNQQTHAREQSATALQRCRRDSIRKNQRHSRQQPCCVILAQLKCNGVIMLCGSKISAATTKALIVHGLAAGCLPRSRWFRLVVLPSRCQAWGCSQVGIHRARPLALKA
jgi:hypothetical protein